MQTFTLKNKTHIASEVLTAEEADAQFASWSEAVIVTACNLILSQEGGEIGQHEVTCGNCKRAKI